MSGFFDSNYNTTEQEDKKEKMNLVRKKLKRVFNAAFDSAEGQKIDAECKLRELRKNFESMNINNILDQKEIIIRADETKKAIAVEYEEMFGEKMV